ncbi:MAG: hypothetical protein LBE31_03765, partial [Deltaproteobacteria bacterium]|nr:hypothetical protein [Deltaproteobacteria bacterium]
SYEHTPIYNLSIDPRSFRPLVTASYDSFETYAISTAISFDSSTLRAEAAFKSDYPFQSSDITLVKRNDYQGILGWDRTFFTNLVLNVQGFFFRYDGGQDITGIDRSRYGFSMSLEDKFFYEALISSLRGVYYMNNQESSVEWFNEYDVNDHLKINFGYILLTGKPTGSIGQFDKNDHAYLGFKYFF